MESSAAAGGGGGGANSNSKAGGHDDLLESGGYHHDSTATNHRSSFQSVAVRITLVFVVLAITCLVLNQSTYPPQLFQRSCSFSESTVSGNVSSSSSSSCENHASPINEEDIKLDNILKKAAMNDSKTVIITTLNAAWTEPNSIFDLFLESFRIGNGTQNLLKHVVVAALDQKAYSRCLEEQLHCYALTTTGVDFSGEALFMTEDYLKMMWRRIDFLRTVLQIGYDFVFTEFRMGESGGYEWK